MTVIVIWQYRNKSSLMLNPFNHSFSSTYPTIQSREVGYTLNRSPIYRKAFVPNAFQVYHLGLNSC